MFHKLLAVIFSNPESSFVYYILPVIFSLALIIFVWIFFLLSSQIFKKKIEKWKSDTELKSFSRRLAVSQYKLIEQTLTSFRIVLTVSIFLTLLDHIFHILSIQIKENISQFTIKNEKILLSVSSYCEKFSNFFDSGSSLILNVFFTIIVSIWCCKVLQKFIEMFLYKNSKSGLESENARSLAKKDTLKTMTKHVLKAVITVIAVFTILQNLGINIVTLLATAGAASVAIAFGAQSLIKDLIAGFFILFEDQFTMGDRVELNASPGIFSGSVEKMTLRMVRIRSNEGSLVTIPNGDIKSVKNFTTNWSQIEFKCSLDLNMDYEKAAQIFRDEIEQFVKEYPSEIIGNPDIRPLEKIVDSDNRGPCATFRFFLKTINSAAKTKLEMEFNKRLLARFRQEQVY
jgi:small-conductance mechanosensitive channel